jgi:hypothetical protein
MCGLFMSVFTEIESRNASIMDLYSSWRLGDILELDMPPCVANITNMLETVHAFTWLQTLLVMTILALIYYYLFLPMNYVRVSR